MTIPGFKKIANAVSKTMSAPHVITNKLSKPLFTAPSMFQFSLTPTLNRFTGVNHSIKQPLITSSVRKPKSIIEQLPQSNTFSMRSASPEMDEDTKQASSVQLVIHNAVARVNRTVQKLSIKNWFRFIAPLASETDFQVAITNKPLWTLNSSRNQPENIILTELPTLIQTEIINAFVNDNGNDQSKWVNTTPNLYIQLLMKHMNQLIKGTKTHISLIYETNGQMNTLHVDVRYLLNDPINMISQIAYTLNQQGAANQSIGITFTSLEDIKALMQASMFNKNKYLIEKSFFDRRMIDTHLDAYKITPLTSRAAGIDKKDIPYIITAIATLGMTQSLLKNNSHHKRSHNKRARSAPFVLPETFATINNQDDDKTSDNLVSDMDLLKPTFVKSVFTSQAQRLINPLPLFNPIPTEQNPDADSTIDNISAELTPEALDELPQHQPSTPSVTIDPPLDEQPSVMPNSTLIPSLSLDDRKKLAVEQLKTLLTPHEKDFYQLLDTLKIKTTELQIKSLQSKRYQRVGIVAKKLDTTLTDAATLFFNHPSAAAFMQFKSSCTDIINEAALEFKKHRSIWGNMSPILKGLLGVIALLTVIPALIVSISAKQGYIKTFFSNPKTDSINKLETFNKKTNGDKKTNTGVMDNIEAIVDKEPSEDILEKPIKPGSK